MKKQIIFIVILIIFVILLGVLYFGLNYLNLSLGNNMLSKNVSEKMINEYCPPNDGGRTIIILKNSDGFIGGYVVRLPVQDTPISYLDPDGNFITSFYIFGTDEEKEAANKISNELRRKFPIDEPLTCPAL